MEESDGIIVVDHALTTTTGFREALYETARSAGLKIISDDLCCRLLAYLYIYCGENEQSVFNSRLRTDIFEAQQRLNLLGGEAQNTELLPVLQNYITSITGEDAHKFWQDMKDSQYENPPEWMIELEKQYGIKALRSNK